MITMLLPSKNRPDKAKEALSCFYENRTCSEILLVLNEGEDYGLDVPTIHVNASSMCEAVNLAAKEVKTPLIGFIGDDHYIRTKGFDLIFSQELVPGNGVNIVYGNDLLQGERLATHCVMRKKVIDKLGYMAIPGLKHLYMDNFWMELGAKYVPEVIVEHMHYTNGKSERDDDYLRVNSQEIVEHDRRVFEDWKQSQKHEDLKKIGKY